MGRLFTVRARNRQNIEIHLEIIAPRNSSKLNKSFATFRALRGPLSPAPFVCFVVHFLFRLAFQVLLRAVLPRIGSLAFKQAELCRVYSKFSTYFCSLLYLNYFGSTTNSVLYF
jgi:hypothetical protein